MSTRRRLVCQIARLSYMARNIGQWPTNVAVFLLAALLPSLLTGCHRRQYYRRKADSQAYCLIDEKSRDPRWMLHGFNVYPDEQSRCYDPNNVDRPPMPPDDPESHKFMHCVYGMRGYKRWHRDGDQSDLENPIWRDSLIAQMSQDPDGKYVMTLESAIQLALLHSPQFQRNLEELYLSALDVSFERFRFDVQYYGGNVTSLVHRGSENASSRPNSSSLLSSQTYLDRGNSRSQGAAAGVQKLLPTGGQFLAEFANSFVWQLSGPDSNTTAQSLLSFNLVQPLLRAGGRDVVLERLTIAERSLLANIRQMERFRQGFLLNVAYGSGNEQGPSRRGGFLGGSGLTGFTGTGTGGFGGVGEATGFGRFGGALGGGGAAGGAAGGGFAAGVAVNVGGFIGLVQQLQQVRTRKANLDDQIYSLDRVEAYANAGRINQVQVLQIRQNVQTARSQYLDAVSSFERGIESFLTRTLGLPPDLPVRIDESIAEPFRLADAESNQLRIELGRFYLQILDAASPTTEQLADWTKQSQKHRQSVRGRLDVVQTDIATLERSLEKRLATVTDATVKQNIAAQPKQLKGELANYETQFSKTSDAIAELTQLLSRKQLKQAHDLLALHTKSLLDLMLDLAHVQGAARVEAVTLKEPVRLDSDEALRVALANRLDIMNQRAEVVDQWRLIAFNANDLESDLDVTFSGDIGTLDRNIVKFRNQTGRLFAGIQFDAPLTRLGERNEYRQALIDFQRVRRDYIQFIDSVQQSLRDNLRRLTQLEQEMELRRQAVRIAIQNVDILQKQLEQPPAAGAQAQFSDTLVRNLLAAYADLLQTQNDVMGTYLNYELLRLQLYRDLGLIEFDERGLPTDEPLDSLLARAPRQELYLPPDCSIAATNTTATLSGAASITPATYSESASEGSNKANKSRSPWWRLKSWRRQDDRQFQNQHHAARVDDDAS